MKNINFNLILQIAMMAVIAWFIMDRRAQDKVVKEYWENPNFVTDSIKTYVDYEKLPKPEYKHHVPPNVVINYIDSTKTLDHISLVMDDSLITVIDSLQSEITTIHEKYFKLYPTASKLIYGEFSRDSVRFDLLRTDGSIKTSTFGVNYGRFDYQYTNGNFRASEKPRENNAYSPTNALFGYAGYNVTIGKPMIGLDYSIYRGKFRLQAESFLTLTRNTDFYLGANIGFKLK